MQDFVHQQYHYQLPPYHHQILLYSMISVFGSPDPTGPNDLFCQSAMRRRCSASACSTFSCSSWEGGSATSSPDQPCGEGTFPQRRVPQFSNKMVRLNIEIKKNSRFVGLYRFPFRVDMKSRATKIQWKIKRWEGSFFFVPLCCYNKSASFYQSTVQNTLISIHNSSYPW